jgi:hypothetical protein
VRDVDGVLHLATRIRSLEHVSDAGRALLSALSLPSGIYNVCRDGDRVSAERFTRAAGWHPTA